MASTARQAIQRIEHGGHDVAEQVTALREDVAAVAEALARLGGHSANRLGHNALDLAGQVSHQGAVAAREIGKQANMAGRAVRENPAPMLVALGTVALLAALVLSREASRDHHW